MKKKNKLETYCKLRIYKSFCPTVTRCCPTSDNELFAITVMSTQLCERAKTAEEIYEGMCECFIENTEEREK